MTSPILITGGTGFVGRALVASLAADGTPVRVLGRREVPAWRDLPHVEHLRMDLGAPASLERAVRGARMVYHLAAATSGSWAEHLAVTVEGTRRLLAACADAEGVRVIHVSSLGNYDGSSMEDGTVVDEDFPLERNLGGRGHYAAAKTLADRVALDFLRGDKVRLTIARPAVVYGPGMKSPLAGAAFPLGGRAWAVPGSGSRPLPLVYIDDAVRALTTLAGEDRTVGKAYNIVHPEQPTQDDYLRRYAEVSGDERPVVHVPVRPLLPLLRAADAVSSVFSRNAHLAYKARRQVLRVRYNGVRLIRDTGFNYRVGMEEGLRRTVADAG